MKHNIPMELHIKNTQTMEKKTSLCDNILKPLTYTMKHNIHMGLHIKNIHLLLLLLLAYYTQTYKETQQPQGITH